MGRNCAKTAPSKTSSVHVDGKFNHLIRRNGASFFVLGMWKSSIRQVKRLIYLIFRHGIKRRINNGIPCFHRLYYTMGFEFVGLLLHVLKVGRISFFILKTGFMSTQGDRFWPIFVFRYLLI